MCGLVADVDDTLNEVAGIRLPDIQVPLGCHTGWKSTASGSRCADPGGHVRRAFSLFRPIELSRAAYETRVRRGGGAPRLAALPA